MTLILKRAKFSRPSGQWQDEEYDAILEPHSARAPQSVVPHGPPGNATGG